MKVRIVRHWIIAMTLALTFLEDIIKMSGDQERNNGERVLIAVMLGLALAGKDLKGTVWDILNL